MQFQESKSIASGQLPPAGAATIIASTPATKHVAQRKLQPINGKLKVTAKRKKKQTPKQRADALEREYYRGALKEAHPKWQEVYKEVYG